MDQTWIIFALIFGAVLLGVQASYMFVRERKSLQAINRRIKASTQGRTTTDVLELLRRERGFANLDNALLGRLSDFWTQTGLRFHRNLLFPVFIGLTVPFFIVLGVAIGFEMIPLMIPLAVAAAIATIVIVLYIVRSRRMARFSEQFPDAIDVIVRGLRAGLPFSTSLNLVAREMPDPAGTEFGITVDEISFGLDIPVALENLYRRVGQGDLLYFVIAMTIQTETGGRLSDVLTRLSRLVRQRATLRLKVKALTAEGRLSAIFLSLMPFIMLGGLTVLSPDYFAAVKNDPLVPPAVLIGSMLLVIGNVIIYRMVNFKY